MRLAALTLLAGLVLAGCGGSNAASSRAVRQPPQAVGQQPVAPPLRGPAFGITEDNADLLWPAASASPSGGPAFQTARERLAALHPRYVRLLVDWAALAPDPHRAPALDSPVDGCARALGPCGAYAGIRDELRALAAQQRAAAAEGRPGYEVVLDLFGTPAWAARPASGCEPAETQPFSRPINGAGIAGYRALIRSLLALGAREGVALTWWAPWNEPNDAVFVSPQRASCAAGSPSLAPAVYAELAQAMADELNAHPGVHHLLLGELNAFASDSAQRTSIASFVAALPASVMCLSDTWSVHAYAARPQAEPQLESTSILERALDARGSCASRASIWVTEAGAGAPHPGRKRPAGAQDERSGCATLARQLARWVADPRLTAILQYSFREDPAFPVGLVSADLAHVYPAYRLWLQYTRGGAQGLAPSSQSASCA